MENILEIGLLSAGLGINSLMDLKTKTVSLKIMVALFLAGCFFRGIEGELFTWSFLLRLVPGIICFLLTWITRGGIGMGDGCMFLVLGTFLSLEELLVTCMIALGAVGVVALVLMVGFHKKKNYEIPFVPFLFMGFVITKVLYGG